MWQFVTATVYRKSRHNHCTEETLLALKSVFTAPEPCSSSATKEGRVFNISRKRGMETLKLGLLDVVKIMMEAQKLMEHNYVI